MAPGDDAELEHLRLRAYGPDADIDTDPAAQARLSELERARRAPTPPAAPTAPVRLPPRPPMPEHPAAALHSGAPQGPDASATDSTAPAVPARPESAGWSRRIARLTRSPRAVAIAAVALLIVLAVAIVPGVVGDRPAATLRVEAAHVDEKAEWIGGEYLERLGVEMDDIVRYQDYEELQIWASPGGAATRCVFVLFGDQGLWAMNCTPRGLDPTTDVAFGPAEIPPSMRDEVPDLPDGTVLRFTLKGDAVEVRVATPDVVDPADS